MKVVIPVAGAGTRLRPHTYTQPKALLPVAGKPMLAFIVEALQAADIKEFIFVIGHFGDKIKDFIEANFPNINACFIIQEHREGVGHAIWTAQHAFEQEEEVLIVLGDIIFETNLENFIHAPTSCIGIKKVTEPRGFGIIELKEDNISIKKVIEKPKIPKSDLAIVGIYKIKEVKAMINALDFLVANNIRSHEEIQLTDALEIMLEAGSSMSIQNVDTWFDCGRKEVMLETNRVFLARAGYDVSHVPNFEDTVIIHPVNIGANCAIANSIIGPFVTIGNDTNITSSIIQDSIIGNFSQLRDISLKKSIIGSDTVLKGAIRSLNIGDNTEIDFS
jgi:glucose-1-phosphate thymidylyltransferase